MKYGKLRIAWSIVCGLACVLLIALWVRSYWSVTIIQVPELFGRDNQLILSTGTIHFNSVEPEPRHGRMVREFESYQRPGRDFNVYSRGLRPGQFDLGINEWHDIRLIFPYWFAASVATAFAVLPWIRWKRQFSLRTLLMATTLIAVVLGAIVYLTKTPTTQPVDVGDFGR